MIKLNLFYKMYNEIIISFLIYNLIWFRLISIMININLSNEYISIHQINICDFHQGFIISLNSDSHWIKINNDLG